MSSISGVLVEVPAKERLPPMSNGKPWDQFKIPPHAEKPTYKKFSKYAFWHKLYSGEYVCMFS